MFIAALFTTHKTQNQPRCSTDELIKKMLHTHVYIYMYVYMYVYMRYIYMLLYIYMLYMYVYAWTHKVEQ